MPERQNPLRSHAALLVSSMANRTDSVLETARMSAWPRKPHFLRVLVCCAASGAISGGVDPAYSTAVRIRVGLVGSLALGG